MLPVGLHLRRWDRPGGGLPVDFTPVGIADLTAASRRQHRQPEGQLGQRIRRAEAHLPQHGRNPGIGQGRMVLVHLPLAGQHLQQVPASRVVLAVSPGDHPVKDRLHPLPETGCRLVFYRPKRLQHVHNVGGGDLVRGKMPYRGFGVEVQGIDPLVVVSPAFPCGGRQLPRQRSAQR